MEPLASLRGVSFSRKRAGRVVDVLNKLSIDFFGGQAVGIMGKSGVGKSTLLNLIAGYLRPTEGEVFERGKPVAGPAVSRVVVFQSGGLWPWLSLEKNVALGLKRAGRDSASRREIDEILERFGIADARTAYPAELSGGMQKRGELARAILAGPSILMLDEALGSVDPVTKEICIDVIREYRDRAGACVLMVSHNIDEVIRIASAVIVLRGAPAAVERIIDVPQGVMTSKFDIHTEILNAFGYSR